VSDTPLHDERLGTRRAGGRRIVLPRLRVDEAPFDGEAPPVPSMDELLRPTPGITRFLDALGLPDS
jgi:hypothetical protein